MKYLTLLAASLLLSCTEPYIPELKDNGSEKVLIVEGYINAEGNSEYTLGYISPLYRDTDSSYIQVNRAELSIEEENGEVFSTFSPAGNSRYIISHPALNPHSRYRLRIKADDKEYLSDFVTVLVSPEIRNLKWQQNIQEGVRFYLDTESDDLAYYRWEVEDTWRFRVPNMSLFLFDGTTVRERSPAEYYPLFCYMSEKSNGISLYTTETQNENTVKDYNVHFIPVFSEKLGMRYSLLVKQYALTKEAFAYWSLVKKNSEEIGDIFGTMPTELTGNISCISDPEQKVVGMIEAGKIAQKRIFIDYSDFPIPWAYKYVYYGRCIITPDNMIRKQEADAFFAANPDLIPIDETSPTDPGSLTHYSYSVAPCLDCSFRGSKEAPHFWEDR